MSREMHTVDHAAQAEYVKARQHGYEFAAHGRLWNYLYSREQVNPEDRERMPAWATHAIWVVKQHYVGKPEVVAIIPTKDPLTWLEQARAAAHGDNG